MNWSMPGFSVLHYLPEVAQTHVQWVGDAIQPSHPLSPLSPALNLSQHQGFFQWVSSLCYRVLYLAEGNLSITQLCKLKSHHITWVSGCLTLGMRGLGSDSPTSSSSIEGYSRRQVSWTSGKAKRIHQRSLLRAKTKARCFVLISVCLFDSSDCSTLNGNQMSLNIGIW